MQIQPTRLTRVLHAPPQLPSNPKLAARLRNQINDVFAKPKDDAGILYGVRKFRGGRPHAKTVLVPSRKNGGLIPCEAGLEPELAKALEIDPDVKGFRSQALGLMGPKGRELVIDFVAVRTTGEFLVIDVKPHGRLSAPDVIDRMRFVRETLSSAGLPHRIVTERQLEEWPKKQIRDSLRKGITTVIPNSESRHLTEFIRSAPCDVGSARLFAINCGIDPFSIEQMVIQNQLRFSINHEWSAYTKLEINHGTNQEPGSNWGTIRDLRISI
nr:hypothetical protein [Oceanococcus sp. HetDA_MAG_MS8]